MSRCIRERWPRTGVITADETGGQGRRGPESCRPRHIVGWKACAGVGGMRCGDRARPRGSRRSGPDRLCRGHARGTMEPFTSVCVKFVGSQHDSWITVIIHQMWKRREGAIGGRSTPGDGMIPRHQHAHRPRDLRRATRTRDDHTVLPQRRIGEPWVGAVCASLRHGTRCTSGRTRVERIGGSIRHGRRQAGRSPEVSRTRARGGGAHRIDPGRTRDLRTPRTPCRTCPEEVRFHSS